MNTRTGLLLQNDIECYCSQNAVDYVIMYACPLPSLQLYACHTGNSLVASHEYLYLGPTRAHSQMVHAYA